MSRRVLRRPMLQPWAGIAWLTTHVLPPMMVFVLSRLGLAWAARASGYKITLATTWSRWDSAHYLSVAERGYELFSCGRLPGYDPAHWCGNTAWLPGYPMLIRALTVTGLSPEQCGVLISAGFTFAGLALLWNAFLDAELNTRNVLTLALAALFPGHVYYAAVFPIAMCTFFLMLAIKQYEREKFIWAGVAGCVAAFTYSTGFFLAFVFGLHLLLWQRRERIGRLTGKIALASGLTFAGFLAVILVQRIQVGAWDAYQLVQAKYHYAFTPPWTPLLAQLHSAFEPHDAVATQAAFLLVTIGVLLWAALSSPRRPLESLLAIYALTFWLVPLMLGPGYVAVVRAESMLLPIVPLARKLPIFVLVALVLFALLLAHPVAALFFQTRLV